MHPSCWDRCIAVLTKLGHESRTIDWVTAPWARGQLEAVEHLSRELNGIDGAILVGHSLAGIFLPLLGSRINAKREMYIAALASDPKHSLSDRLFAGEEIFEFAWIAAYGGMSLSLNQSPSGDQIACIQNYLFHDCPSSSFAAYWRPPSIPLNLFYESRFSLTESHIPRNYVVCTRDRTIRPEWQRKIALEISGAHAPPMEFASGHCPQIAKPSELAHLIHALAEQ
jgi:Alpha/beta hydrolase family